MIFSRRAKVLIPPDPMEGRLCAICGERTNTAEFTCEACKFVYSMKASQQDRIMAEPNAIAEDWMFYQKEGEL